MTDAKFRELDQVNTAVNTSIQPVTDLELYGKVEVWTYPTNKQGIAITSYSSAAF